MFGQSQIAKLNPFSYFLCAGFPVYWNGIRFWAVKSGDNMNICTESNAEPANIYNQEIFDGVMNHIRSFITSTHDYCLLGMTYDPIVSVILTVWRLVLFLLMIFFAWIK